jgi:hypothetical protein
VLDIAFQEDATRMRKDLSQQNFVLDLAYGPQSAQTGADGQVWHQSQAAQGGVE